MPAAAAQGFSVWRLVVWLLLLLSAFGILQYVMHGWQVLALMHTTTAAAATDPPRSLRGLLLWDALYLLGAGLTLCLAAGALLRREWARRGLRVMAVVLALWALVTGVDMLLGWQAFQRSSQALAALPGLDASGQAMLLRLRRTFVLGMSLKLVAVPVLAWLAWRLGKPALRAQFGAAG